MRLAWLSASVRITVVSSVRLGMHASFAFQHETYVSAASVPERSGERPLEREVRLERPADEAHRRRPRPVALETLDPGANDLRVPGEPEVVVRREDDHLAAPLHPHDRPLRRLERQEALVRAGVAQRVELRAELLVEQSWSRGRSVRSQDDLAGLTRLEERERLVVALERQLAR